MKLWRKSVRRSVNLKPGDVLAEYPVGFVTKITLQPTWVEVMIQYPNNSGSFSIGIGTRVSVSLEVRTITVDVHPRYNT